MANGVPISTVECCARLSAPLVIAARILIGKGADPTRIIEVWHRGADAWALRGQLGPVAAVRLAGERREGAL